MFLISLFYFRLECFFIHSDFFHHIKPRKFWEHKPPNTGTGEYIYSPFTAFWITSCVNSNPALWSGLSLRPDWISITHDYSVGSRSVQDITKLLSPAAWSQQPKSFCPHSCVCSISYMACLNQSCAMTLLKNPTTSAKSTDSWADAAWLRLATQDTALSAWTAELLTDQLPKYCRLQHGICLQILL